MKIEKIDELSLKTYSIVIAGFKLQNKLKKILFL